MSGFLWPHGLQHAISKLRLRISETCKAQTAISSRSRIWISTESPQFTSVQSFSHVQLFATPWTATLLASLSITNSQSWLKFMSIELIMPSNHLILSHSFLLLPSIFCSTRGFSNESVLHIRWPKYWSFSIQSFQWIISIDFLWDWLVWSLCCTRDSLESIFFVFLFSFFYIL